MGSLLIIFSNIHILLWDGNDEKFPSIFLPKFSSLRILKFHCKAFLKLNWPSKILLPKFPSLCISPWVLPKQNFTNSLHEFTFQNSQVFVFHSAHDWDIALWLTTNMSISYILVLAGSESVFTDITAYTYFSLPETRRDLEYTSGYDIVL